MPKPLKANNKAQHKSKPASIWSSVANYFNKLQTKRQNFLKRRPHRSLQLTKRRDYVRSLNLPGYFSFTLEVFNLVWKNKAIFLWLGVWFIALYIIFNLMGTQDNYQKFRDLLEGTAPDSLFSGITGDISKAGILLFTALTQGLGNTMDSGQRLIALFIGLYSWLTIVWLLRNIMAGRKVNVRDGLYNAGAPILPTILMVLVFLVQLIPLAIAIIVASAAWQSGFLSNGAWAMLAAIGILLIVTMSLYWVSSTIIAMIVITLPGMYPMRALVISGDLVVGRRLRLVYRFVWMILMAISWWVVIMIPVILFDSWIKGLYQPIDWLPIVPVMFLVMSTFTLFWTASYVYLLYRKMVDDDVSPA